MQTTSVTLLEQLQLPGQDAAWARFTALYMPLLRSWADRCGLPPHDSADLVQEVFAILVQKMSDFRYDRDGSFRAWLRAVTMNKLRDWKRQSARRNQVALDDVAEPAVDDPLNDFWEEEYRQQLLHNAVTLIRQDFEPKTWAACWEFMDGQQPASVVAAKHGMTENSVYVAKSRVIQRLRDELTGLLE